MFKVIIKGDREFKPMTVYAVSENEGEGSELWFLTHTPGGWDWINAHSVKPYEEEN